MKVALTGMAIALSLSRHEKMGVLRKIILCLAKFMTERPGLTQSREVMLIANIQRHFSKVPV